VSLCHLILDSMFGSIQLEKIGQQNLELSGLFNTENKNLPKKGRLAQERRSQRLRMSSNLILLSVKM
jgi:hypothetical protein